MTDLLETRTRQLEHDSQNAEFVKVEADEYDHRSSPAIISTTSGNNAKQMSSSKGSKNRIHEEKVEKSSGYLFYKENRLYILLKNYQI